MHKKEMIKAILALQNKLKWALYEQTVFLSAQEIFKAGLYFILIPTWKTPFAHVVLKYSMLEKGLLPGPKLQRETLLQGHSELKLGQMKSAETEAQ